MKCWGLGGSAVGHMFPKLDMVRCRRCRRVVRGIPIWFGWEEWSLEAECEKCSVRRHAVCVCQTASYP